MVLFLGSGFLVDEGWSSFLAHLVMDTAFERAVSFSTFFVSFSWNSSPKSVLEEGNSSAPYLDHDWSTVSRILEQCV